MRLVVQLVQLVMQKNQLLRPHNVWCEVLSRHEEASGGGGSVARWYNFTTEFSHLCIKDHRLVY